MMVRASFSIAGCVARTLSSPAAALSGEVLSRGVDRVYHLTLLGALHRSSYQRGVVTASALSPFARGQQSLGGGADFVEQGCVDRLVQKTVRDCVAGRQAATENGVIIVLDDPLAHQHL